MLIRVGYDITYNFPAPTDIILMLAIHPSRDFSIRVPEGLICEPPIFIDHFTDLYGNRCARAHCPRGRFRLRSDAVVQDNGLPDAVVPMARQFALQELPPEVLHYLIGSRYCELEKLTDLAWTLFGQGPQGWARVQAICDWVHNHVTFGYHFARSDRTAYETYLERRGVCRDFMHLAIALCRCMGIPARYATGYLGDIHVPPDPNPMDFSAWFEAFLEGQWYTFDARNNTPRVGRVLIARGQDAADVALTTSFGRHILERFRIVTEEIDEGQIRPIS